MVFRHYRAVVTAGSFHEILESFPTPAEKRSEVCRVIRNLDAVDPCTCRCSREACPKETLLAPHLVRLPTDDLNDLRDDVSIARNASDSRPSDIVRANIYFLDCPLTCIEMRRMFISHIPSNSPTCDPLRSEFEANHTQFNHHIPFQLV